MKLPFFEIIDIKNEITILLIEDQLDKNDQKELDKNYEHLSIKINELIYNLQNYFKFESIHSLKESIQIREECRKYYKAVVTDKGNGSIYSQLINNYNFDYKAIIYDDSDKIIKTKTFGDILKNSIIDIHIKEKENINIENINLFAKPGKGQKLCKKCKKVIGARSITCKYCKEKI